MTSPQTAVSEYTARTERADRLSFEFPFAQEFLVFYKHVAAFQKNLLE